VRPFRADVHALTGAYAVNAIDDEFEREKFERHMRRCQQCSGEVRGLTETATRLAFSASRPPPPAMRDSVLSAVSLTRQLPPIVEHRKPKPQRWWTDWTPTLALSFATAIVTTVAVVLLLTLVGTYHELNRVKAQNAALSAVLSAPDSHAVTSTISSGVRVTLVYSLRKHAMIVTTHGLPAPPPGKVYQLWFIGPPTTRSAGFLPASQAGRAGPVLSSGLAIGDTIGITIEPAGGTSKPTTTPILLVPTHG
jgi:anti-sigma-K factor RskA